MKFHWLLLLLNFVLVSVCAEDHGVILLYHHVSEEAPSSTSVTPEQFRKHLDYLQNNNFNVVSLNQLLNDIYAGKNVMANTVAITFDDAYLSVYQNAFPELHKRGWPFTVFVANGAVDNGYQSSMSWEQLKEMAAQGAEFGGHSVSHAYLARRKPDEPEHQWRKRVQGEITQNLARLEKQLGTKIYSFAYPYGEYDQTIKTLIAQHGVYGLAQQSGAVGPEVSPQQIPRFPMAEGFADMQRFITAINSRPLPVRNINAGAMIRKLNDKPPIMTFELGAGPYRVAELACYSSGGKKLKISHNDLTYRVQLTQLIPGRNKINCTAPSSERKHEYFWYSHLWLVKNTDGFWHQY